MLESITGFVPSTPSAPKAGQQLDKNAFLKLLTAQLQYQDPLDPQSQDQMFGTLSQMGVLEQITNLNSTVSGLVHTNQLDLVGREVKAIGDDEVAVQGVVEELIFNSSGASIKVNGQVVPVENIIGVVNRS